MIKKTLIGTITAFMISISIPTQSKAVMEVHDSTAELLLGQNNLFAKSSLTLGQANSFVAQIGLTRSFYENILNDKLGLGGTPLGRYASHVGAQCLKDIMKKIKIPLEIPPFDVCGTNLTADLANYIGRQIMGYLASLLKTPPVDKDIDNKQGKGGTTKCKGDKCKPAGNKGADDLSKKKMIAPLSQGIVKISDENNNTTTTPIDKNYLEEKEIKKLERTVSGFFDYIENLIENRQTFTMKEFAKAVDRFLSFNEYRILDGKGRISKEKADQKALAEYKEFNKHQPIESDFDKEVKKILNKKEDNKK